MKKMTLKAKAGLKAKKSFLPEYISTIRPAKRKIARGKIDFLPNWNILQELINIWKKPKKPIPRSTIEWPWSIGLSKQFIKDVRNSDRKMQGLILRSITQIAENPITPRGDTIKFMTHHKGFWRYRIGDYRLKYSVDQEKRQIALLSFEGRGEGYDQN